LFTPDFPAKFLFPPAGGPHYFSNIFRGEGPVLKPGLRSICAKGF